MHFSSRFAAVAAIAFAACASPKSSSSLADAGATPHASPTADSHSALDPALTVATVNGTPVKAKELDDQVHDDISKATDQFDEQVQKIREEGLDELIAQKLVEAEAKTKGVTKEALIKKEITDKIQPPTPDELQYFYTKFVKPRYDVPFDAVQKELTAQVMQQKSGERAKAYFDELRTKYKVTIPLPVHRVAVAATGPSRGPLDAKVTIVEFSDFECPYCGKATPTVEALMKKYDGKVRLVFRQFPLPMHKSAPKAAEAALCANAQDSFWPMYNKLFANQEKLEISDLKGYAKELGLDTAKFDSCLDGGKMAAALQADIDAGKAAGVDGTPAFFINGRPYSGALPQEKFEEVIDSELSAG